MPSKRKKNKRRMRRVQAQRRALEEQHAASPPVKASPGIAASTPPAAAAKTPKIPEAAPIASTADAPTVAVPRGESTEPAAGPVLAAEVEVEVRAQVDEEAAAAVETPPAAPLVAEIEPVVPETEVPAPAEAPAAALAEIEVQQAEVDTEAVVEDVGVPEVQAEAPAAEDASRSEPAAEASEELPTAAHHAGRGSADAAVDEAVWDAAAGSVGTEAAGPERATSAASAEDGRGETRVGAPAEEDAPPVPAEPVTTAEVADSVPESLVEKAESLVSKVTEAPADFAVTECVPAVKEIVAAGDPQTESVDATPAEPEPAKEMLLTGLEVPKSETCEVPCQTHLAVESVQLSSVEMAAEATLNGHVVPEVSIEG